MVPELATSGGGDGGNVVGEPFDREFRCNACMNPHWIRIVQINQLLPAGLLCHILQKIKDTEYEAGDHGKKNDSSMANVDKC